MLHVLHEGSEKSDARHTARTSQWSLHDLWRLLKWRRSEILWVTLACLAAAVGYLAITPLTYKARAVVITDTKRVPPQPYEFTPDTAVDMAVVETQVEAIRSEKLALGVIDELKLWEDPEFNSDRPGFFSKFLGYLRRLQPAPSPTADRNETERMRRIVLDRFLQRLDVQRVGRSYVTEITFRASDPQKAAQISNALAERYIFEQLNAKQETLQRSNQWLQDHIAELRNQANAAQNAVELFQKQISGEAKRAAPQSAKPDHPTTDSGSQIQSSNSPASGPAAGGQQGNPDDLKASEDKDAATLQDLMARAETAKTAYQSAANRFKQALQIQEQAVPATEARILTEAIPPVDGYSPKLPLVLMLALIGGGTLGVTTAIGREYLQNFVRTPRQIQSALGVRVLCAVPDIPKPLLQLRRPQAPIALIDSSAKAATSAASDEAIRRLKIAVDQFCREKSCVIGITSPRGKEGTTAIAFNLAQLAARSGARTLLIDANLRNRWLSMTLTPRQPNGIASLATQSAEFKDCVAHHDEAFAFLGEDGASSSKSHPAELLGAPLVARQLQAAFEMYDYVIFDLPPMRYNSDVQAVAPLIDGYIVLAEWEKTSLLDLEHALTSSHFVAQRLIGVALTKVPENERMDV